MTLADATEPGSALRLGGERLPVIGSGRVYVCGITPYDTTHLGHAATFVWTDLAARVLRLGGAEVRVCRNVTDVDDHLLAEARARGVDWKSLASQETYRFERDAADLGIAKPAFEPRSHNHVDDVIELAAELLASGAAYERAGSVFLDGSAVPATSGRTEAEATELLAASEQGAPSAALAERDGPFDVPIWQRSAEGEPSWPSPWGDGRPGWHAECAAMSLATFGPSVDLHGGGSDLAFPHHAYEAAIAERFTGVRPFARSWMHVGTVLTGGEKMAKSAGNLVLVRDLLERWSGAAIRYLIVSRRWDAAWEFDEAELDAAADAIGELWKRAARPAGSDAARGAIVAALLDDLDVPRALELAHEAGGPVVTELIELLGLRDATSWK